jgi:hypothetical protein
LNNEGRLDPARATRGELRREGVFFGKGKRSVCHAPPFYPDNQMHDLRLERFLCLTLEDTVEFFNLVLELKLTKREKADLVTFMRRL